MNNHIEITQPDDWHVHFREGDMLEMVTNFSSRINKRCVAMPNTQIPITDSNKASFYKEQIKKASKNDFEPLVPCYLKDNLDYNFFFVSRQKNRKFLSYWTEKFNKEYNQNLTVSNDRYWICNSTRFNCCQVLVYENDNKIPFQKG